MRVLHTGRLGRALERGSGSVEVFGGFVPSFFFYHSHSGQAQEPNLRPRRVRAALPTSSKKTFPRHALRESASCLNSYKYNLKEEIILDKYVNFSALLKNN